MKRVHFRRIKNYIGRLIGNIFPGNLQSTTFSKTKYFQPLKVTHENFFSVNFSCLEKDVFSVRIFGILRFSWENVSDCRIQTVKNFKILRSNNLDIAVILSV